MRNPMSAQRFSHDKMTNARRFALDQRTAQSFSQDRSRTSDTGKRQIGRWLIRLGQRWAPAAHVDDHHEDRAPCHGC